MSVGISTLKDKIGRSITEGGCKATILNRQFSSVFTEDDSQPLPDINYRHQDMPGFDITDQGIEKLIKGLKDHKAPGPDDLTPILLKSVATEISPILNLIYKASLRQGSVPNDWQHANVCPIFKKATLPVLETTGQYPLHPYPVRSWSTLCQAKSIGI